MAPVPSQGGLFTVLPEVWGRIHFSEGILNAHGLKLMNRPSDTWASAQFDSACSSFQTMSVQYASLK